MWGCITTEEEKEKNFNDKNESSKSSTYKKEFGDEKIRHRRLDLLNFQLDKDEEERREETNKNVQPLG